MGETMETSLQRLAAAAEKNVRLIDSLKATLAQEADDNALLRQTISRLLPLLEGVKSAECEAAVAAARALIMTHSYRPVAPEER